MRFSPSEVRPPYVSTKSSARGAFVVSVRPLATRRAHLVSDVAAIWLWGRFRRLGAATRCGKGLMSARVCTEVPDGIELCDECVLADFVEAVVYRVYDAEGRLLYVGCTKDPVTRLRSHFGQARTPTPWWRLSANYSIEAFNSHKAALAAEARAIVAEHPMFNVDLTDRAKHPARRRKANLHLAGSEVAK